MNWKKGIQSWTRWFSFFAFSGKQSWIQGCEGMSEACGRKANLRLQPWALEMSFHGDLLRHTLKGNPPGIFHLKDSLQEAGVFTHHQPLCPVD